jgi:hypothetical protein
VLLVTLLSLAGCHRVEPIYIVQHHPVPAPSRALSPSQVADLAATAARSKDWLVEPIGPTELRATQKWKDHVAIVIISTDGNGFSITNDGSSNLLQTGGSIHRAYNERVHILESAIEKELYQAH